LQYGYGNRLPYFVCISPIWQLPINMRPCARRLRNVNSDIDVPKEAYPRLMYDYIHTCKLKAKLPSQIIKQPIQRRPRKRLRVYESVRGYWQHGPSLSESLHHVSSLGTRYAASTSLRESFAPRSRGRTSPFLFHDGSLHHRTWPRRPVCRSSLSVDEW
jgi:hypothetical protein